MKHTRSFLAMLLTLCMFATSVPVYAVEPDTQPVAASEVEETRTENTTVDGVGDGIIDENTLPETIDTEKSGIVEENSENDDQYLVTEEAVPLLAAADDTAEHGTVVIAGSDFQNKSGNTAGANVVTNLLNTIKGAGYTSADGFLFCGDYDYDLTYNAYDTVSGINALVDAVQSVYSSLTKNQMVLVKGNHDVASATGLSKSGANDAAEYGVFVINENDYMWRNSNESTIKSTAASLKSYLDEKIQNAYKKPIFVVSHLPLHYSMRTKNDGDGMYANYIFDVLNEAGADGLNIIFLYGHDHSNGWDDYLGGAAVYLEKGDSINIAQSSKTAFNQENLEFTYMNAGFTGYYENLNGADEALTMTVFDITEDEVSVERYDQNGLHALKSAGKTNTGKGEYDYYSPDTKVYSSPETISLTEVKQKVTLTSNNVSVTAAGLTGLTVTKNATPTYDVNQYSAYASYDITAQGYTQGDKATVTIQLDASDKFDANRQVIVLDKSGNTAPVFTSITDGKITFTATHFSTYDVAQAALNEKNYIYQRVTKIENIVDGQYLLIYNAGTDQFMLPEVVTKANGEGVRRTGFDLEDTTVAGPDQFEGPFHDKEWTITTDTEKWVEIIPPKNKNQKEQRIDHTITVYSIGTSQGQIKLTLTADQEITATLASEGDMFKIGGSADNFTFTSRKDHKDSDVLNYNSRGLINGYATGPAPFYIYKLVGEGSSSEIKTVVSVTINNNAGSIRKDAALGSTTGSVITITYSDNSTDTVPVTADMISGTFNVKEVGTYENLTVTYNGYQFPYTLTVKAKSGNNYPEYPDEGSVRVNKTGEGIDFQSSGIAKVELSATGVPVKKGADVIVMLDTSSSMENAVNSGAPRIDVLKSSLKNLIHQFSQVGEDGEPLDIRVAIADFNGYQSSGTETTPYHLDSVDHLHNGSIRTGTNYGKVYTGSAALNSGAFVAANTIKDAAIDGITTHSGTNYDYAFDAAYQLGEAIKSQNEEAGNERDLFVIFMTDGAPFQYNYFSAQSDQASWNNWLTGTITDSMLSSGAHNYYYNPDGNKHRMAEAVKGDPATMYKVIRKNSTDKVDGEQYMTKVPGLGATMYAIGFCLEVDKQITVASMEHVLKSIASSPEYYHKANTAADLSDAFSAIGNDIAYAATNARFVDTMGANYDLQMKTSEYTMQDGTKKTITPEIVVQAYDIYTRADGVAESQIGMRKGTSKQLEKVTFNAAGTEAYSDKKDGNILVNGVITANTFWYNTTANTVRIDTNGDGTADYDLLPETFYWKMGTVNQTDLALSYYVYLTGSMEGTREAGSYPTNESATLYYTNWLGNDAKKDTVSPVLAWKSANVSYAFYLVDENGNIIVNKETGQTGSFANKVAVTNPVVFKEVLLNSAENVQADILATQVLPEGYTLYDSSAEYKVQVNSNSTGSWDIKKGTAAATTYVTEYGGEPTTELTAQGGAKDYTHTVVWFAVKYVVKAIPDAVVIDYGLPVDIHVLKNDMFYDNGALQYIGAERTNGAPTGEQTSAFTTTEYGCKHGAAKVILNNTAPEDSVVRYTPKDMKMDSSDKFSYAVNYTGAVNSGYYYGTVTVIPATKIYYEDGYVTYTNSKSATDSMGTWIVDGNETRGATQDEDRPGTSSLNSIDANNVYGFDSTYKNFTKYSLGAAHKVTVDETTGSKANAPEAKFEFTGTGFDVISLTDNDSGTIIVTVTDSTGAVVAKKSVDNYYGYSYGTLPEGNGEGWYVDKNSTDTIWQVPVIKIEDLTYGTYTATIQVAYASRLDHQGDGSYSFWLDAIRIYNPAKNDETAQNAYKLDKEAAPEYMTLRDLLVDQQNALKLDGQNVGVVFIDGKDSTTDVTDYANPGPNNETYLAYGQGVSFKLVADQKPETVQLGVKLAYGNSATLKMGEKDFQTVTTATDMYYKMDGLNWKEQNGKYVSDVIVLSNATKGGVISITNIKYTFNSSSAEPIMFAMIEPETVKMGARMMFALYNAYAEEEPEVQPEEAFKPARFEAKWNAGKLNKASTLTVTTSDDVESISVNGKMITSFQNTKIKGTKTLVRTWNYSEVIKTAGTYEYDVVAYNADGIASDPICAVLNVKKK